jgi:hypothetical protein
MKRLQKLFFYILLFDENDRFKRSFVTSDVDQWRTSSYSIHPEVCAWLSVSQRFSL